MSHRQKQQNESPGKNSCNPACNSSGPNRYGQQMDLDPTINLQLPTGDTQQHGGQLQSKAAIRQYFEEGLRLYQQPKRSRLISTPSTSTIPNQKLKTLSNKRPPFQTIKNPKVKLLKVSPPTEPSYSQSSTHQAYDTNQTARILNCPQDILAVNANNGSNATPSYTSLNPNHTYSSSIPTSVISRNDDYNRQSTSAAPEIFSRQPIHEYSTKIKTITTNTTTTKNEDIPPLAHSNNVMSTSMPRTFRSVGAKPNNLQTEPLDLAVGCTKKSNCSYTLRSVKYTPSQLDSINFNNSATISTSRTKKSSVKPTADQPTLSSNITPVVLEPVESTTRSSVVLTNTQTTNFVETKPIAQLGTSLLNVSDAEASTSTAVRPYSSPYTYSSGLPPAYRPEMISKHPNLKKTWLQRHAWTEVQRESGVYMGPSTSKSSFTHIDDIPHVKSEVTSELPQSSNTTARQPIPELFWNRRAPMKSIILKRVDYTTGTIVTFEDNDSTTASSEITNSATAPIEGNDSITAALEVNDGAATASEANDSAATASEANVSVAANDNNKSRNNPNEQIMVKIPLRTKIQNGDEVFFQSDPCLSPTLTEIKKKCRECLIKVEEELNSKGEKVYTSQSEIDKISCRFYDFRLLLKNKEGQLLDAGFPDPYKDIKMDDLNLWMPNAKCPPKNIDVTVAKKVLQETGQQFCSLVREENKTMSSHISQDPIVWKKPINGVRVMCDVCVTTIFNYHWSCKHCGFDVCKDCVTDRIKNVSKYPDRVLVTDNQTSSPLNKKDTYKWMICSNNKPHNINELMFTQMLAGNSLNNISKNFHIVCNQWKIPLECGCPGFPSPEDGTNSDKSNNNPVKKLKVKSNGRKSNTTAVSSYPQTTRSLRVTRTVSVPNVSNKELKYFIRTNNEQTKRFPNNQLPLRTMTLKESKQEYPNNPHTWLCDGRLLRLLDPNEPTNYSMFRKQWIRGQPVLVSGLDKKLKKDLWTPTSFSQDFGELKNDLVDCVTGQILEGKKMKVFWDGFVDESKRMKNSAGKTMLLKLKDWPGSDDFSETMPNRFKNLMAALPLKNYTQRQGKLNLANSLPDKFLKPDLGPKMYSAYGDAALRTKTHPKTRLLGTTNLHLDVSDAVNVMAFISISKSESKYNHLIEEAYKIIDQSGCDDESKKRARMKDECPGAVWHIYHSKDSDAIRDLLNKVSEERGQKLQANHDPIHDQSSYLDEKLRFRLYQEYGVQGYAVLQCLGDAILIPAGAPHQVRNLHNCIKVAQDFVSPENLTQCLQLTNEFRCLSSSHSNHEDKLQIKNIMYHSVKNCVSVLMHNKPPCTRSRPRYSQKPSQSIL